jgi:histidine triad (HIT) family protein
MPTLFAKIIKREIPAEIVYEDEHVVAFKDINPQAPVHVLIVPRSIIRGIDELPEEGDHMYILNAAKKIAQEFGLTKGYRLVINQGEDAGQVIDHLHAHLIGGRTLHWPPG